APSSTASGSAWPAARFSWAETRNETSATLRNGPQSCGIKGTVAKLAMFAQAFRTPDLRKKLLFTLGIIVVYRFGASLPAPGISTGNVRYCSGLATSSQSTAA